MKRKLAPTDQGKNTATLKLPELNTWWLRTCNQKRYFLRQIHDHGGQPFVWIYQEGINRCYHLPLKTLLKRYIRLHVGPVDPATGNIQNYLN